MTGLRDQEAMGTTSDVDAAAGRSALDELRLARIHLRLGMLAIARAELEDLERRALLQPRDQALLAEARWRSGDTPGAVGAARARLSAGGRDPVATAIAVESAAAEGRPSEARALMDRLGDLDAIDVEALFAGMPKRAFWPSVPGATSMRALMDEPSEPPPPVRRTEWTPAALQRPAPRVEPAARYEQPAARYEPAAPPQPAAAAGPAARPEPAAWPRREAAPEPSAPLEPMPAAGWSRDTAFEDAEARAAREVDRRAFGDVDRGAGPRSVLEATSPSLWGEEVADLAGLDSDRVAAAARTSGPSGGPTVGDVPQVEPEGPDHPDPMRELAEAREELATDPDRALLRIALVLRTDPTLAPAVLDAIRLRRETAAIIIRGDAERLLGRHLEAEAAFSAAVDAIERPERPERTPEA
jgi:hypothetical protein